MPRYTISETAAVWVTWTSTIEAETVEEATRIFREGGATETEESIGDSLDEYGQILKLEMVDGVTLEPFQDLEEPGYSEAFP